MTISGLSFLWTQMLWLLLAVPLLVAGYILIVRLRRRSAVRYARLGLVKQAGGTARTRRHLPPLLMLSALALLILSLARPAAIVTLPSQRETIILAMDVSGSMRATDVNPRRITAAQAAARDFVKGQPHAARLGLVAFSTSAMLMQAPTLNRDEILAAINRLQPQRFTAVGSGILVSLKAIFPKAAIDLDLPAPGELHQADLRGVPLGQARRTAAADAPVAPGTYRNAVIVLMSDGQTNTGADPLEAAHVAASHGVRVFTVGFGTESGGIVDFEGRPVHVQLDEDTLKAVADITRGSYFRAGDEAQLKSIYKALSSKFVIETEKTEITAIFAAAAALAMIAAGLLSVMWFGRIL